MDNTHKRGFFVQASNGSRRTMGIGCFETFEEAKRVADRERREGFSSMRVFDECDRVVHVALTPEMERASSF
jgi:hypothetical protein